MELSDIKRIGVIGAGAMGAQITQLFAQVGQYPVTIADINMELVNKGIKGIDDRLQKFFVEKGKITAEDKKVIMGRIKGTDKISEVGKNSDFVIEAAAEILDIKRKIFKELDDNAPANTILASNTSELSVTEMAKATNRPDRVIGTHFFNPVAVMKLVEIITTPLTSPDIVKVTVPLMTKINKEPVICKDVGLGFMANRAYSAMAYEAALMVWEHVGSPQDIDKALKLGYNLPMGPLELFDYVGGWALHAGSEPDRIRELGEKGRINPMMRLLARSGYGGGLGKKGIYAFWDEVMSKW